MTDIDTNKYETWKADILRDYPKLRTIPHYVDALLECYKENPGAFEDPPEEENPVQKAPSPPRKPIILFGVSKLTGDEVIKPSETVPVPDALQQPKEDGDGIEVSNTDS